MNPNIYVCRLRFSLCLQEIVHKSPGHGRGIGRFMPEALAISHGLLDSALSRPLTHGENARVERARMGLEWRDSMWSSARLTQKISGLGEARTPQESGNWESQWVGDYDG